MNQDFVYEEIDFIKSRNLKDLEFYIKINLNRGWELHGSIIKDDDFYVQPMIYKNKKVFTFE